MHADNMHAVRMALIARGNIYLSLFLKSIAVPPADPARPFLQLQL